MIKKVLTIAGSDSGGGAGIQADMKTFSAFGVYGMTVVTAVTAQNSLRVNGIEGVSPQFVSLQFESILSDCGIDGAKTGMLYSSEIVRVIANKFHEIKVPFVIVDPVLVSSDGTPLIDSKGIETYRKELIPEAYLVTPNIFETETLSGVSIKSIEDVKEGARRIFDMGCRAVLVKGGHLEGDPVDILYDGERFIRFTSIRVKSVSPHGTGCTYSAAILANLVKGNSLVEAIRISKRYIVNAIREGFAIGKGSNSLNHFVNI